MHMEKYGFVYLWFDRKHRRYYIGSHWGNEKDGYVCSSTWMKQAYKHRPYDFKRRILSYTLESRIVLLELEYRWLVMIKKDELGKRYYNLHNHQFNHWSTDDEKFKLVNDKLKLYRPTEETRLKISLAVTNPSSETRTKMSKAAKRRLPESRNSRGPDLKKRKSYSEEYKQSLRRAHGPLQKKRKPYSEEYKRAKSIKTTITLLFKYKQNER